VFEACDERALQAGQRLHNRSTTEDSVCLVGGRQGGAHERPTLS
jgi:hypothetical protein